MKARAGCIALAFGVVAGQALACGACVEDAVAATYDHALVTEAAAAGRVVVFVQVGAGADLDADATRRLMRAAAALPGVRADSVRVSASPAALSFALDPARTTAAAAVAALRERTHALGLELRPVKTFAPGKSGPRPF